MADTLTIKVTLPPETLAVIEKYEKFPEELPKAIKRGMDRSISVVRGRIQENRLSGKGPFPKEQGRLGERTGALRQSVREEPAVIKGQTVTGTIGMNLFYGWVHEFGLLIRGKPVMRFQIGGKWIMARTVIIPPRKVMRIGVAENLDFITEEIASEIEKSLTP